MSKELIEFHRPNGAKYQVLGMVRGLVRVINEKLITVNGFPFYEHNSILAEHDGKRMLVKFWVENDGTSRRVRKCKEDPDHRYDLPDPILLITAYIEPDTERLIVPFGESGLRRTRFDDRSKYRMELDLHVNKAKMPVFPGRRYHLTGVWRDGGWVVDWKRDACVPIDKHPEFAPFVETVPTEAVQPILKKHDNAVLNPRKTEPLQAYVAAYQCLPKPIVVQKVGSIYQLISGFRGLITAKRFGLRTVPISDGSEHYLLKDYKKAQWEEKQARKHRKKVAKKKAKYRGGKKQRR